MSNHCRFFILYTLFFVLCKKTNNKWKILTIIFQKNVDIINNMRYNKIAKIKDDWIESIQSFTFL